MQTAASGGDYRKWFSVNVHLPKTTVYKEGDWQVFGTNPNKTDDQGRGAFIKSDAEIKNFIWGKWQEQFETAESESNFTIKFLYNFKQILAQYGIITS